MTTARLSAPRPSTDRKPTRCQHVPRCPTWDAPDHAAARVVTAHHDQGWSLLCNGVVVFSDTGEILPSCVCVDPHRPGTDRPMQAA
jgi:Family of unknown function (DUF5999)